MLTDDAQVTDFQGWELNTSLDLISSDQFYLAIPHLDLNYGLLPNLQLTFDAPLSFEFREPRKTYLGAISFGAKYHFLDEKKHFISAAVFPQYNFNVDRGLFLPIFVEKTFGRLGIDIMGAYFLGNRGRNRYEMSLLMGYLIYPKLCIMAEYYHIHNRKQPDGHNGLINFGFRQELTPNFFLMASGGTQILTPAEGNRSDFISWLGVKILF